MTSPEIDFLMETEYALQSQLERVQFRLAELLTKECVEAPARHLSIVPDPEGA